MKTKVGQKGKKRSLSETSISIKSYQKQGNINESNKSSKRAKFTDFKQNGNPTGEKAPIFKIVDKQKKKQNKIIEQQNSIAKPSEVKKDTRETAKLTIVKTETVDKINSRSRNRCPYSSVNLTAEQITKKITEIKSREVLSKRAKRILGILNRKLRQSANESKKLDIVAKKSNIKLERYANTLIKNMQKVDKRKAKNKHIQSKGKSQEEDDDSEIEKEKDDIEEESDESEVKNKLVSNKREEIDDESDEEENEEEAEDEEDEEDVKKIVDGENIEDEEEEDEDDEEEDEEEEEEEEENENEDDDENEEEDEDEEDEDEDEEDEKDDESIEDEEDEEEIIKKAKLSELRKKEVQNKNKQALQSLDNQKKEVKKKRYVLFVGNLPLNITEDDIKKHFLTKVGTITSIRIPTKPDKTPRGFAYVEVTNNIDFEKGLSLNHTFLKKKRINVQYSMPMGHKMADATKKLVVAKNLKLQALQKAGKLADGNEKKKSFKKEK